MKIYIRIFILVFFVFFQNYCGAAELSPFESVSGSINTSINLNRSIDIVYINGIDNNEDDAIVSIQTLLSSYFDFGGKDKRDIRFSYIYNPTGGKYDDKKELNIQGDIAVKARNDADIRLTRIKQKHPNLDDSTLGRMWQASYMASLRRYLSKYLYDSYKDESLPGTLEGKQAIGSTILKIATALSEKVLAGHKVVVVSHSQGNLFAEEAYAHLSKILDSEKLKAITFVGVGCVAGYIPKDGPYTTLNQDEAVSVYNNGVVGSGTSLPANFDAIYYKDGQIDEVDNGTNESYGHNFVLVYMNKNVVNKNETGLNVAKKIIYDIDSQIDLCIPASQSVEISPITATLTWLGFDTDIDLLMIEHASNDALVWYRNKIGTVSYLDLDDRTGYGPEHIYIKSNNDLSGDYTFIISAYDAPIGDVATLSINFENRKVYTREVRLNDQESVSILKLSLTKTTAGYNYILRPYSASNFMRSAHKFLFQPKE